MRRTLLLAEILEFSPGSRLARMTWAQQAHSAWASLGLRRPPGPGSPVPEQPSGVPASWQVARKALELIIISHAMWLDPEQGIFLIPFFPKRLRGNP